MSGAGRGRGSGRGLGIIRPDAFKSGLLTTAPQIQDEFILHFDDDPDSPDGGSRPGVPTSSALQDEIESLRRKISAMEKSATGPQRGSTPPVQTQAAPIAGIQKQRQETPKPGSLLSIVKKTAAASTVSSSVKTSASTGSDVVQGGGTAGASQAIVTNAAAIVTQHVQAHTVKPLTGAPKAPPAAQNALPRSSVQPEKTTSQLGLQRNDPQTSMSQGSGSEPEDTNEQGGQDVIQTVLTPKQLKKRRQKENKRLRQLREQAERQLQQHLQQSRAQEQQIGADLQKDALQEHSMQPVQQLQPGQKKAKSPAPQQLQQPIPKQTTSQTSQPLPQTANMPAATQKTQPPPQQAQQEDTAVIQTKNKLIAKQFLESFGLGTPAHSTAVNGLPPSGSTQPRQATQAGGLPNSSIPSASLPASTKARRSTSPKQPIQPPPAKPQGSNSPVKSKLPIAPSTVMDSVTGQARQSTAPNTMPRAVGSAIANVALLRGKPPAQQEQGVPSGLNAKEPTTGTRQLANNMANVETDQRVQPRQHQQPSAGSSPASRPGPPPNPLTASARQLANALNVSTQLTRAVGTLRSVAVRPGGSNSSNKNASQPEASGGSVAGNNVTPSHASGTPVSHAAPSSVRNAQPQPQQQQQQRLMMPSVIPSDNFAINQQQQRHGLLPHNQQANSMDIQPVADVMSEQELEARAQQEYVLIKWGVLLEQQRRIMSEWERACIALRHAQGKPTTGPVPPLPGIMAQPISVRHSQLGQLMADMPSGLSQKDQQLLLGAPPLPSEPYPPLPAATNANPSRHEANPERAAGGNGTAKQGIGAHRVQNDATAKRQTSTAQAVSVTEGDTGVRTGDADDTVTTENDSGAMSVARRARVDMLLKQRKAALQKTRLQREQQLKKRLKDDKVDATLPTSNDDEGFTSAGKENTTPAKDRNVQKHGEPQVSASKAVTGNKRPVDSGMPTQLGDKSNVESRQTGQPATKKTKPDQASAAAPPTASPSVPARQADNNRDKVQPTPQPAAAQKQAPITSGRGGRSSSRERGVQDNRNNDRDKYREREKERERDRSSRPDRDGAQEHRRSFDGSRGRSRDDSRERSRARSRDRSRERSRERTRGYNRERSRERARGRRSDSRGRRARDSSTSRERESQRSRRDRSRARDSSASRERETQKPRRDGGDQQRDVVTKQANQAVPTVLTKQAEQQDKQPGSLDKHPADASQKLLPPPSTAEVPAAIPASTNTANQAPTTAEHGPDTAAMEKPADSSSTVCATATGVVASITGLPLPTVPSPVTLPTSTTANATGDNVNPVPISTSTSTAASSTVGNSSQPGSSQLQLVADWVAKALQQRMQQLNASKGVPSSAPSSHAASNVSQQQTMPASLPSLPPHLSTLPLGTSHSMPATSSALASSQWGTLPPHVTQTPSLQSAQNQGSGMPAGSSLLQQLLSQGATRMSSSQAVSGSSQPILPPPGVLLQSLGMTPFGITLPSTAATTHPTTAGFGQQASQSLLFRSTAAAAVSTTSQFMPSLSIPQTAGNTSGLLFATPRQSPTADASQDGPASSSPPILPPLITNLPAGSASNSGQHAANGWAAMRHHTAQIPAVLPQAYSPTAARAQNAALSMSASLNAWQHSAQTQAAPVMQQSVGLTQPRGIPASQPPEVVTIAESSDMSCDDDESSDDVVQPIAVAALQSSTTTTTSQPMHNNGVTLSNDVMTRDPVVESISISEQTVSDQRPPKRIRLASSLAGQAASNHGGADALQQAYASPLSTFRTYPISEAYHKVLGNQSLSPTAVQCSRLDGSWPLCAFDVRGSCRDMRCRMQHLQDGYCKGAATTADLSVRTNACQSRLGDGWKQQPLAELSLACAKSEAVALLLFQGRASHIKREARVLAGLQDVKCSTYYTTQWSLQAPQGAAISRTTPFTSMLLCSAAPALPAHLSGVWTASHVPMAVSMPVADNAADSTALQNKAFKSKDARQNRYFTSDGNASQPLTATENDNPPGQAATTSKQARAATDQASDIMRINITYSKMIPELKSHPGFWIQWACEHVNFGNQPYSHADRAAALEVLQQGLLSLNVIDLTGNDVTRNSKPGISQLSGATSVCDVTSATAHVLCLALNLGALDDRLKSQQPVTINSEPASNSKASPASNASTSGKQTTSIAGLVPNESQSTTGGRVCAADHIKQWAKDAEQMLESGKLLPGLAYSLCLALAKHSTSWQHYIQVLQQGVHACAKHAPPEADHSNGNTHTNTGHVHAFDLALRVAQQLCDSGVKGTATQWFRSCLPVRQGGSSSGHATNVTAPLSKAVPAATTDKQPVDNKLKSCLSACAVVIQGILGRHPELAAIWQACYQSICTSGNLPRHVLHRMGYPQTMETQLVTPTNQSTEQLLGDLPGLIDSCVKNANSVTDQPQIVQPLGAEAPQGVLLEAASINNASTAVNGGMQTALAAAQQQAMLRSLNLKLRQCMLPAPMPLSQYEAADKRLITLANQLDNHQELAALAEVGITALRRHPALPDLLLKLADTLPQPQEPWYHVSNLGWSHYILPLLATALLECNPAAPAKVWAKAVSVTERVSPAAAQELIVQGLSVHPFSLVLWQHKLQLCGSPAGQAAVSRDAVTAGLQL